MAERPDPDERFAIEGDPEDALRGLLAGSQTDVERRLRDAGSEFIESHKEASLAIAQAASAGLPRDAIAHVSGLSPETVAAFLRDAGV